MPKLVFLATDVVLYVLLVAIAFYVWHALRTPTLRADLAQRRCATRPRCPPAVVLGVFLVHRDARLVHFRPLLPPAPGAAADAAPAYSTRTLSLLDALLAGPREAREKTYSVPLGTHQYSKESMLVDGKSVRDFPRLAVRRRAPQGRRARMGRRRRARVRSPGLLGGARRRRAAVAAGRRAARRASAQTAWRASLRAIWRGRPTCRGARCCSPRSVLALFAGWVAALWPYYHVFGTDQTGNDVLYQALKSIRTAVVIGTLATLATLPFAIVFGILAGYFKGWVDDVIQYLYTMLSSIPTVLLIAAFVLMIQVFIDKNPQMFETGLERADIRLFLLCAILGITGWAGLARLLRAETLKLRELDYVQAARAFGVSDARHHAPPHPAQRDAHRADRRGARFLRAWCSTRRCSPTSASASTRRRTASAR